jgi:hypothetical protein
VRGKKIAADTGLFQLSQKASARSFNSPCNAARNSKGSGRSASDAKGHKSPQKFLRYTPTCSDPCTDSKAECDPASQGYFVATADWGGVTGCRATTKVPHKSSYSYRHTRRGYAGGRGSVTSLTKVHKSLQKASASAPKSRDTSWPCSNNEATGPWHAAPGQ